MSEIRTRTSATKQTFTDAQYQDFKKKSEISGVVRKKVSFNEINLVNETTLIYGGVEFEMTKEAFGNLVKISGLSGTQMNKIGSTLGEKFSQSLLKLMQTALAGTPGKDTICMLVNRVTSKIVGFTKTSEGVLSNGAYFSLFEDVMNNHAGMEIKNMALTENGNIEISVLNKDWEFNIGGLKEEFFNSGIVFINTPDATIINPFNERLTCTNGMVVSTEGLSLILKNSDATSVNGFYDAVRNLKGIQNFEQEFKHRVVRMMDTTASYGELNKVRKCVEDEVNDITNPDVRATVESFIPEAEVRRAFLNHKIDLLQVDAKQYKKIRTNYTVWDLVNSLTDLSSHNHKYGIGLKNGNASVFSLQREAGALAFKEMYDLESPVKQIF